MGVLTMSIEPGPGGAARRIFVQLQGLSGFAVVDFAKRAEVDRIKFPEEHSEFPPNSTHGSVRGSRRQNFLDQLRHRQCGYGFTHSLNSKLLGPRSFGLWKI